MLMLCFRILAVSAGFLFLCMGYHFYKPAPDIEDASEWTFQLSMFKVVFEVIEFMHYVGIMDKRFVLQDLTAYHLQSFNYNKYDHPELNVSELTFTGVPVVMYEPNGRNRSQPLPALVYIHGGGFSMGNGHVARNFLWKLVNEFGMVCFSIEYRLAPQFHYPAQLEDCESASRYIFEHASELGVNTGRIGVCGDGAGGNLAAVLTIKFRDMGSKLNFMYQVLIYPWVQLVDVNLPSYKTNEQYSLETGSQYSLSELALSYGGFSLAHRDRVVRGEHVSIKHHRRVQKYMNSEEILSEYVHEDSKAHNYKKTSKVNIKMEKYFLDPYAWPLMADNMRNLPPALIVSMEYDTLRDEGLMYLRRLKRDGVEVEHYHDKQGFHSAFDATEPPLPVYQTGIRLTERLAQYIKLRLTENV